MAVSVNALTTLSRVKIALGITGTSDDTRLERLINVASTAIENYCNRKFLKTVVTNEKLAGFGGQFLGPVKYLPIVSESSITYNDDTVDSSQYEIYDDGSQGLFYALNTTWYSTAQVAYDVSMSVITGQERLRYKVNYTGGYVLPDDSTAPTVQGTGSEDFAFSSDLIFTTEQGVTTTALNGLSTQSADDVITLINAAVTATGWNDVVASESPSGKILLTHNNDYSSSYITVTANDAATKIGLSTTQASGDRTLPDDIEEGCIDTVTTLFRSQGRDKNIESEKLMSGAVTYIGGKSGDDRTTGMLTDYAKTLINPYRVLSLA